MRNKAVNWLRNRLQVIFRNKRDKYKGHKYYKDTVDFCENWDQKSFDPKFKSLSLKEFEPFVKKIFSRKPYSI